MYRRKMVNGHFLTLYPFQPCFAGAGQQGSGTRGIEGEGRGGEGAGLGQRLDPRHSRLTAESLCGPGFTAARARGGTHVHTYAWRGGGVRRDTVSTTYRTLASWTSLTTKVHHLIRGSVSVCCRLRTVRLSADARVWSV